MNILTTDVRSIPLAHLTHNDGQIEGVPANPRQIDNKEYAKLKKSLKADNLTGVMPLKVYLHNGSYVVLGGNMRLRALKELGAESVPCIVVPEDASVDVLRKIVISDNSTFGDWDMDLLANNWDAQELEDWGVEVPSEIADEEPPTDLDAEERNKPFVAKITFDNAGACQAFIDAYKTTIEQEFLCTISVSGGEL